MPANGFPLHQYQTDALNNITKVETWEHAGKPVPVAPEPLVQTLRVRADALQLGDVLVGGIDNNSVYAAGLVLVKHGKAVDVMWQSPTIANIGSDGRYAPDDILHIQRTLK